MSALHRSRRQPAAAKDPLLRSSTSSRQKRSASREKSDTPHQLRSPSVNSQLVNGSTTHTEASSNSAATAQLAAAEGSTSTAVSPDTAAPLAAKSDNSSSGLSEPDETAEEGFEPQSIQELRRNQRDADSEAETERLEDTPHKKQKHTTTVFQSRLAESSTALQGDRSEVADDADEDLPANVEEALADDEADDEERKMQRVARGSSEPSSKIITKELPSESSGRKRKRTSSMAAPVADGEPAPKRTSARNDPRSTNTRTRNISAKELAALGALPPPPPPDDDVEEHSSNEEDVAVHKEATSDDDGPTPEAAPEPDDEHAVIDDDIKPEANEPADDPETVEGAGAEDAAEEEGEEDEGEPGAKNEDEIAKKRAAMDALMPIENLFAIFRDKLFDERLSLVSAELDMLNQPNPTHSDYLEMKKAIDARRDEKVQLEQVLIQYRIGCLENKAIADRSQLHSQFYQAAREIREDHLVRLNEAFCRVQRERRKWKAKEPHYSYTFKPNRADQVSLQKSYNREISILSGIARHVGFPAAPKLEGARSSEIEDDFKAMKLKNNLRQNSAAAQLANSARSEEMAAKEQFLESTPWANPNHPVHQQAMVLEQQPAHPRAPFHTPAGQRWLVDLQHQPGAGSGGSTIPASDPPSSMVGVSGGAAVPPDSHHIPFEVGRVGARTDGLGSSPLDQFKRRVSQPHQEESQRPLHSGMSSNLAAPTTTSSNLDELEHPTSDSALAAIPGPIESSSDQRHRESYGVGSPARPSQPQAPPPSSPISQHADNPTTEQQGSPGPQETLEQVDLHKATPPQSPPAAKTELGPEEPAPPTAATPDLAPSDAMEVEPATTAQVASETIADNGTAES